MCSNGCVPAESAALRRPPSPALIGWSASAPRAGGQNRAAEPRAGNQKTGCESPRVVEKHGQRMRHRRSHQGRCRQRYNAPQRKWPCRPALEPKQKYRGGQGDQIAAETGERHPHVQFRRGTLRSMIQILSKLRGQRGCHRQRKSKCQRDPPDDNRCPLRGLDRHAATNVSPVFQIPQSVYRELAPSIVRVAVGQRVDRLEKLRPDVGENVCNRTYRVNSAAHLPGQRNRRFHVTAEVEIHG